MIPMTSKPTPDLRPITLTNISYKLILSLIGQDMDEHIINSDENKGTQAGFSRGDRVRDILLLQYSKLLI